MGRKSIHKPWVMSTATAVQNVERYVIMLERGEGTQAARRRYNYAIGHLKTLANYMENDHYAEWARRETECRQHEAEHGANLTPMSEVLKHRNRKE